jgi:hypothetical protein
MFSAVRPSVAFCLLLLWMPGVLSVVMLNVCMLGVIMHNVVMMNVVMLLASLNDKVVH